MYHSGEDVDNGEGAGWIWNISVSFTQFCCESKTSLKTKKKNKNLLKNLNNEYMPH